tara:strand:- start:1335 stop:1832 length:498 start_codon:yes stop_codon:yes gene_type:complete
MKALNEFLNEKKDVHSEIESFLKTRFKKVSKTTNSGVTDFYGDEPKSKMSNWSGALKVVVGRDGLSSIEGMEGDRFEKDELFKELKQITESLNEGKSTFKVGDKVTAEVTKGQEAKVTEIDLDVPGFRINGKRGESFDMIHIEWKDKKKGLMSWAGKPDKFTQVK